MPPLGGVFHRAFRLPGPDLFPEQRALCHKVVSMVNPKLVARRASKRKSQKAWLDRNPQIRERRNKEARDRHINWTPDKRAKVKAIQRAHYDKRELRRLHGLCAYSLNCNEPSIGTQKFCLWHWCYGIRRADQRLRSSYSVEDLIALWKRQDGKCALTGIALVPGSTAALDHIVPVAKDGLSVISNLRFIHWSLNKMKWDMTDEQFRKVVLATCPALIEWAKQSVDTFTLEA
jgi:hypothetical protein